MRYHIKVQGILPESHKAEHVIVVIITDGMENASTHRTYQEVKELIERQRAHGWEILFLGANIDAAAEAKKMGIAPERASQYVSDGTGSLFAYDAVARAQCETRLHGAPSPSWNAAPMADAKARGGMPKRHWWQK